MHKERMRALPLPFLYKKTDLGEILISDSLLDTIINRLTQDATREEGGFLAIDSQGSIAAFCHDQDAKRSETYYMPNAACLKRVMYQWSMVKLSFGGIVHTHTSMPTLSRGDLLYIKGLLECNPGMDRLIMGVITKGQLRMWLFEQDFIPWMTHKLQTNEPLYL